MVRYIEKMPMLLRAAKEVTDARPREIGDELRKLFPASMDNPMRVNQRAERILGFLQADMKRRADKIGKIPITALANDLEALLEPPMGVPRPEGTDGNRSTHGWESRKGGK
jgi:hypothetical protein